MGLEINAVDGVFAGVARQVFISGYCPDNDNFVRGIGEVWLVGRSIYDNIKWL